MAQNVPVGGNIIQVALLGIAAGMCSYSAQWQIATLHGGKWTHSSSTSILTAGQSTNPPTYNIFQQAQMFYSENVWPPNLPCQPTYITNETINIQCRILGPVSHVGKTPTI